MWPKVRQWFLAQNQLWGIRETLWERIVKEKRRQKRDGGRRKAEEGSILAGFKSSWLRISHLLQHHWFSKRFQPFTAPTGRPSTYRITRPRSRSVSPGRCVFSFLNWIGSGLNLWIARVADSPSFKKQTCAISQFLTKQTEGGSSFNNSDRKTFATFEEIQK